MKTISNWAYLGMLLAMLTLTACGGGEDSGGGTKTDKEKKTGSTGDVKADDKGEGATYAAPEEVFAAFKAAAAENDMKGVLACMTQDSQNQMVMASMMMAAFLPLNFSDDQEKVKKLGEEIKTIMEKHGLTEDMDAGGEEPDIEKYLTPVKDRAQLAADLFALMQREDPDSNPFANMANAELKDVKMDGETATGKFSLDGRDEDIEFVMVNGNWLIKMPEPSGPEDGGDGGLPEIDPSGDDGSEGDAGKE